MQLHNLFGQMMIMLLLFKSKAARYEPEQGRRNKNA